MNDRHYTPSIFETFNARHLTPEKVAATFVPPDKSFETLATNNNHILVGPRGSGKTTLLKMLTLPALMNWKSHDSQIPLPKVDFIGIFVPADRGWRSQLGLSTPGANPNSTTVGSVAFTTQILRSFVTTLRDIQRYNRNDIIEGVTSLPHSLTDKKEKFFCDLVAEVWGLELRMCSLAGLNLALRARLADIKNNMHHIAKAENQEEALYEHIPYSHLDYRALIKFAIDAYVSLADAEDPPQAYTWALLFDEFEIAPTNIQEDVIGNLRGDEAGHLISKLALAPFNESFMSAIAENDGNVRSDYEVIHLSYPLKEAGTKFTESLFEKNLTERGMELESPSSVLGSSGFKFDDEGENSRYELNGKLYAKYRRLAEIDASFAKYLLKKKIELKDWDKMVEGKRAPIRKFRSIVITREYFLSKALLKKGTPKKTSRKIAALYTGAPTILSLCEGNPRILIGMLSPIFRELEDIRRKSKTKKVPISSQAQQVKYSVSAFRSLLKTIAFQSSVTQDSKGLLHTLDEIGQYLHEKCVLSDFSAEPSLTFTVPSDVSPHMLAIIGRALNMGAVIYIPAKGASEILTSIKGKRFRLSYLMAAYYKLPIMMGNSISLSTILESYTLDSNSDDKGLGQVDLFDV